MADLFWLIAIPCGFLGLICLGALFARLNDDRPPMARYVGRATLPPPSAQCERHCYREMQ